MAVHHKNTKFIIISSMTESEKNHKPSSRKKRNPQLKMRRGVEKAKKFKQHG